MATITIKKTKLGKRFVLLEKQYELIPALWEEVMSYFSEAIEERLNKLGIPALHNIFKSVYNMRIANITNSRIALEKRRARLMGHLMKYHHRENSLVEYIKKPVRKDWSGHHLGLLVRWKEEGSNTYTYGRIVIIDKRKGTVTAISHHFKYTDIMPVFADDVIVRVGDPQYEDERLTFKTFTYPLSQCDRKNDEENNDGLWAERQPFY